MKKVTKTITKKQVIEALETEPLTLGNFWVYSKIVPDCSVCAVGAVLRRTSFERAFRGRNSMTIGELATKNQYFEGLGKVKSLLKSRNWLGALSSYFEGLSCNMLPREKKTIAFVKKNFPAKFQLTIEA